MSFRYFTQLEIQNSGASGSKGELCLPICLNAAANLFLLSPSRSVEEGCFRHVNTLFLSHNSRTLSFKSIGVSTRRSRISPMTARTKPITNITIKRTSPFSFSSPLVN